MDLLMFNGRSALLLDQAPAGKERRLGFKTCLCSVRMLLLCCSVPALSHCSRGVLCAGPVTKLVCCTNSHLCLIAVPPCSKDMCRTAHRAQARSSSANRSALMPG